MSKHSKSFARRQFMEMVNRIGTAVEFRDAEFLRADGSLVASFSLVGTGPAIRADPPEEVSSPVFKSTLMYDGDSETVVGGQLWFPDQPRSHPEDVADMMADVVLDADPPPVRNIVGSLQTEQLNEQTTEVDFRENPAADGVLHVGAWSGGDYLFPRIEFDRTRMLLTETEQFIERLTPAFDRHFGE